MDEYEKDIFYSLSDIRVCIPAIGAVFYARWLEFDFGQIDKNTSTLKVCMR